MSIPKKIQDEIIMISRVSNDRTNQLLEVAIKIAVHFLQGTYGEGNLNSPDTITLAWPYVRTLVYDQIRPNIQGVPSEFANIKWGDPLLIDLANEANWIVTRYLPNDITLDDWIFLTEIFPQIFMHESKISELGLLSEKGMKALKGKSMMAGFYNMDTDGEDLYRDQFQAWKDSPEYNLGTKGREIEL